MTHPSSPASGMPTHATRPDATPVRVDFISDVTCPWCAIGLRALSESPDQNYGIEITRVRVIPHT